MTNLCLNYDSVFESVALSSIRVLRADWLIHDQVSEVTSDCRLNVNMLIYE